MPTENELLRFEPFGSELLNNGPTWKGPRPPGVPRVLVLSAREATTLRPRGSRSVLVSIRDVGTSPTLLRGRWAEVLRLEVVDIAYDPRFDPSSDSLAPQAQAIREFVERHRKAPLIAFNCAAGISRSRTVAAVVCRHYGWPYRWHALHYTLEAALLRAFSSPPPSGVQAPL